MNSQLERTLALRLAAWERAGLARVDRATAQQRGDGLHVLSSNDYLGLAHHAGAVEALSDAARKEGIGSTGSRLITGTRDAHHHLERDLAAWLQTDAALVFTSGYQANVGLLSSLLSADDVVFSDALNHASIIDGVRLARARRVIYPHCDMGALRDALAASPEQGLRVIVSETIFSMDGDAAPVEDLVDLAAAHDAVLVLDEAHALGVVGPEGRGWAAARGVAEHVDVIVGTFGKSFGTAGAFVAGSASLRAYLVARARSFVFTTGLALPIVAATHHNLALVRDGERKHALYTRVAACFDRLQALGWCTTPPAGAILPLIVGDARAALALSERLRALGFAVQAIRPPTVPEGTSRLRVTLQATTPMPIIQAFVDALTGACDDLDIVPASRSLRVG